MSVLMKDSSVEWIGNIPKNWKIARIKDVSQIVKTGKTPPSKVKDFFHNGKVNWFTPGDMTKLVLENGSNRKLIEEAISEDYVPLFNEGAVLLVGIGATVGKVSLINCKASCNQQINAIEFDRLYPKYGLYYMTILSDEIQKFASYVTLPIFTQTETKQLKLPFPKKTEQKQIVDFLDKATLQINDAIKTKEKQLKTLEALKKSIIHKAVTKGLDDSVAMIDSKIEWIGDIPKHWTKDKLFRLTEFISSGGTPTSTNFDYYDGNIMWIQTGDLNDEYITKTSKTITQKGLNNSSAKIFKEGTLLIAMYGATIGKLGIMTKKAATNQACCAMEFNNKTYNKFMYYIFLAMRVHLINQSYGGGQPNISQEVVKQQYLCFPKVYEQKEIVEYLDTEVEKINTLKENVKKQIDKLKEYKKSLIYEYVTGKKQIKE